MPVENIQLLTRNPKGWKHAATEMSMRTLSPYTSREQNLATIVRQQNERWKGAVGREPGDSSFTVVVPVSNEGKYLPSVLATFMLTDIPPSVNANFLLVTNNCNDQGASVKVITDFMRSVGKPEEKFVSSLGEEFSDQGLAPEFTQVQVGHSNMSFSHFDTTTPGKVNTLRIANTVARSHGHNIVLCLEANKYPEPDTIPAVIGGAYRELIDTSDPAGIITGVFLGEDISGEENRFLLPSNIPPASLDVKGGIMAWNPNTLTKDDQDIPATMIDDSAFELSTLAKGGRIVIIKNAPTWRYNPESIQSRITHLVRYRISQLQLMQQHPELTELIKEKVFYMKPWEEMRKMLTEWAESRSLQADIPFILDSYRFIISESERLFKVAPQQSGWDTRI